MKVNVVEAHAITDVHVNLLNSTTVFCLPGHILIVPIVLIFFLLGWYVGSKQKSVTSGRTWMPGRWIMPVKWITQVRWIAARLIESTVACG